MNKVTIKLDSIRDGIEFQERVHDINLSFNHDWEATDVLVVKVPEEEVEDFIDSCESDYFLGLDITIENEEI